ncbi:AraC family transcriptional regulator [Bacillus sp. SB49]|uniref:AraC family transcriptional regulator n=1 Tax=Bacillus sp. SB49 TaxID=1071080 RepID=UPI00047E341E|nr:AraC family transcriptional regulator [Bacillus sp. SB49]QHT45415.1 AraC family transcriptional regulator [Bacillus sp. SB49]
MPCRSEDGRAFSLDTYLERLHQNSGSDNDILKYKNRSIRTTVVDLFKRRYYTLEAVLEKHAYDPLFPFVYMYRIAGNTEDPLVSFHFHDWYELVVVHEGRGHFFIDKHVYPMEKGQIFHISGEIIHKAIPDQKEPFLCSVLLFKPTLIHSKELNESFSYFDPFLKNGFTSRLPQAGFKEIESFLEQMDEEKKEWKGKGSKHALQLYLHWILLILNRESKELLPPEASTTSSRRESWMNEVLLFIDETMWKEQLTLEKLAKEALVTPEHFSRTFKKTTGFTLPQYINLKRLIKAKELLKTTDYSISYIADICGFKSLSYFHTLFRKGIGTTPRKYRTDHSDKQP